ncbi:MAG: hypothetical protein ULS35scaffold63_26 [Phage 33_17]|nr:MAG: hypothetical protein ULS35scaffold63_26 [Phage 33_17]
MKKNCSKKMTLKAYESSKADMKADKKAVQVINKKRKKK